ncbi:MAG TPA: hypothetical protein VHM48_12605 [Candidatus Limnocylindrales bacterium]|nr:hypothetical protein [Candidatus Limnocylindrales bacterium]
MTQTTPRPGRDQDAWARPVARLTTTATGAGTDTVTGKRVAGPIQGFGQMWQKTFRVRMDGVDVAPDTVISHWKAEFPTFWPKGATFYAPLSGISPGEVALLEVPPIPGSPIKMSTGVLVIYADHESFTFMTPEGHALSAWITFSATRDDQGTTAQVQALERTSDPLIEISYLLGANRMNDRFWEQTLENLARSIGVANPTVTSTKVCVDRRRQWRQVGNVRNSPALSMALGTVMAPVRWLRRRRSA